MAYASPTGAKSPVGISNLFYPSAQALTRSVFFVSTDFMVDCIEALRSAAPRIGITNSVQSATHLLVKLLGGYKNLSEDITMSKQPSIDALQNAVKTIDSFSQQGFSEIGAIARLALAALESPTISPRTPDDVAKALRAIWGISDDIENCINSEAEYVECSHTDESTERRYRARQTLNTRIA